MKSLKCNVFLLCLFVFTMAFAQDTEIPDTGQISHFGEYDTNRDSSIDRTEFYKKYGQDFSQWDINQDGNVDPRELNDYTFDRLDVDSDRNLTPEEWERGYDDIFGNYLDDRNFDRYDLDRNQNITYDEFDRSMRATYIYSDIDTNRDRRIDSDELNEEVFTRMDRNQDGTIDETEFDATGSYYTHRTSPTTN